MVIAANVFTTYKAVGSVVSSGTKRMSGSSFVFDPIPTPSVAIYHPPYIDGQQQRFPVHRIYCVGRNYADHVREMGGDPNRSSPTFFTKPPDAVVSSHSSIPYPLNTSDLHYEVELVVAIGKEGVQISEPDANDYIFGFGVGIDLTRRDMQSKAKKSGSPWDTAKAFDQSAPIGCITPGKELDDSSKITLLVNGEARQSALLNQMIWSVPEIIAQLSISFRLLPGDLIFTGTPSGVGPITAGDHVKGMVEGLEDIEITIT